MISEFRWVRIKRKSGSILLDNQQMGSFVVRKCKTLDELITEYVALYGNLYIHEAKISDELYEESWIATDEEVHRFLSKYLWKLSLNDVII